MNQEGGRGVPPASSRLRKPKAPIRREPFLRPKVDIVSASPRTTYIQLWERKDDVKFSVTQVHKATGARKCSDIPGADQSGPAFCRHPAPIADPADNPRFKGVNEDWTTPALSASHLMPASPAQVCR